MSPDVDPGGPFPCGKCGGEHDTIAELRACLPATDDALFGSDDEDDQPTPGGA